MMKNLCTGQAFDVFTPSSLAGASNSDKARERPSKFFIDTSQIEISMNALRMRPWKYRSDTSQMEVSER